MFYVFIPCFSILILKQGSYWIRSDQRERIREIISPMIIKMLKLEFPEEMNQILPIINYANAIRKA